MAEVSPTLKGLMTHRSTENCHAIKRSPDLETLIKKRLSSGGYTDAEDVLRRALEAQDAEESWTDEERQAVSAHIEEGFLQAERGELIDGAQARRKIRGMKDGWRSDKR